MTIHELKPTIVWKNFHTLTQIPRPSKHESKAAEAIEAFGKSLGLESFRDEIGNVIIRKPATPGYENRKGVILQGHCDMVPQKNSDKVHDFKKDPIETIVDGEWIKANGTTLGADNGLGVALAMAVLESKDIEHGPIEVLITIDEETGMTGARELKAGVIKGDILINLDSETEGEAYVGCAGGLDCRAAFAYERVEVPQSDKDIEAVTAETYATFDLAVKGCVGGHSGMDINLGRANANKVMARLLISLMPYDYRLVNWNGGTLRNAIPRESFATILLPKEAFEPATAAIEALAEQIKAEYKGTDPEMSISLAPAKEEAKNYIDEDVTDAVVLAVFGCPDGIERLSDAIPGLVETSNNLAIVETNDKEIVVISLLRGSVDTAKDALGLKMECVFSLAGADVTFEGGYSGWAPNPDSDILNVMKKVYNDLYDKELKVMAIHAGLECGILGGTYPAWDMISMGPTLLSPHSPGERAHIPSVEKCWNFLKEVLKNIPEK